MNSNTIAMKLLNGIFGLLLMSLTYSQAKAGSDILGISPKICPVPKVCAKRDFICWKMQTECDFKNINCLLWKTPNRQWHKTNMKECTQNQGKKICKSSCPFNKRCPKNKNVVCLSDKADNCYLVLNKCEAQKAICNEPCLKYSYDVLLHRCTNAGIVKVGQKGKCAPKKPMK